MKRSLILACALALWACSARAAPAVNTWQGEVTRIWPTAASIQAGGAALDTLPRFGTLSTGDSVVVSDSVNVYGARAVLLLAISSGTDTLTAFQLQSKLPGATSWIGTGGTAFLPYSAFTPATLNSNAVTATVKAVWGVYNETTTLASTPIPILNSYFRWRFKSADARRYLGASGTNLAATGNIALYAIVWR